MSASHTVLWLWVVGGVGDPFAVQEGGGGVDPCRLTSGWDDVCVLAPTLGDALRSLLRVRLLLRQRFCKTAELSKAEVAGKRNIIGYCRGSACAGSSSSSSSPVSSVLRLWVSPWGCLFLADGTKSTLSAEKPGAVGGAALGTTRVPWAGEQAPNQHPSWGVCCTSQGKTQSQFRFRPTPQVSSSLHPLKKAAAGACRGVL